MRISVYMWRMSGTDFRVVGYFGLPGRTLRHLGPYLVFPVIPRFCLTGFTFAQPFLASSLMDYLRDTNSYSKNDGYGLIGASLLVYGGIAVS